MPLFLCHLFSLWPVSINQLSPQSLHLSACLNLFTPFHDNPAEPHKVEVCNSCNECIHVALFFLWSFSSFSQSQPILPSACLCQWMPVCLNTWGNYSTLNRTSSLCQTASANLLLPTPLPKSASTTCLHLSSPVTSSAFERCCGATISVSLPAC